MFFDEFWFTDRPSIFYGWARKNTHYHVPSYETNRTVRYGMLSIDAFDGTAWLAFAKNVYADGVADYCYDLAQSSYQAGKTSLTIILDNNAVHKDKMRYRLWLRLRENHAMDTFRVNFIDTPKYSPE